MQHPVMNRARVCVRTRARARTPRGTFLPGNRNSIKSRPHDSATTTPSALHSPCYSASNKITHVPSVRALRQFSLNILISPISAKLLWTRFYPRELLYLARAGNFLRCSFIFLVQVYSRVLAEWTQSDILCICNCTRESVHVNFTADIRDHYELILWEMSRTVTWVSHLHVDLLLKYF